MIKKIFGISVAFLLALVPGVSAAETGGTGKPNVIVFFADDMGVGDVGAYGSEDIPTPHIDSIATNGILFTDGYVSAPQCAPSRAGLMTGRYQNRFGFEYNYNNAIEADREVAGLPLSETTIATRLKNAGYTTGIIGKWHLGTWDLEQFHPLNRGFGYFFGHLGGASNYFPEDIPRNGRMSPFAILRNRKAVEVTDYLTDEFEREVVDFIDRNQGRPFFLYVPFNAPHGPLQATEVDLARVAHIDREDRRTYAAMVVSMDDAIGAALDKLRAEGLLENTIVFFLTDNGAKTSLGGDNGIYKAGKGKMHEGGIRVPFVVQWPHALPAGRVYEHPVISLDILPTVAAAAGHPAQPAWELDGVDLTPYLTGENTGTPHQTLCWRLGVRAESPDDMPWAIRMGEWKLIGIRSSVVARTGRPSRELYNLAEDPGERNDLFKEKPEVAQSLEQAYREWEAPMSPPAWELKPPRTGGH